MTRKQWPLLIVAMLAGALWANTSAAQYVANPTDHSLKAVGASDVQVTTTSWTGTWGMGWFGLQFHSWGSASARPWSSRTSVAVLRERRGLVR